ncbi:Peptidoglycan-associated lipoprotein [Methylobacterium crusticola]|uniref:Peptidoglycan-associated lipoprotein n=1 Tax=Methylobacterium crusticola TaxID=1697972 RepID=A0ABQ4QZB1_9HYPH|nr:type IVB secretion system protein IcmH/DotU [Methylobacterium crusticola]GJD50507.1 Peptidoglycan-associated lipoprotein [Methylobacterium crusticola]
MPAVFDVYSDNIGLALAAPIFDWLFRIQYEPQMDVEALHQDLVSQLKSYEVQAAHRGLTPVNIRVLLYGLAATVDDIVLKTAWGADSPWAHKSMISMFFRETWGGERFYVLLSRMMSTPRSFAQEIELYYHCLQFGFEGRYRLEPQGTAELSRIREELYLFLRELRGDPPSELSPSWRGLVVQSSRIRDLMPYWLAGLGIVLAAACIYIVLNTLLHRNASVAVGEVEALTRTPLAPAPQPPPPPIVRVIAPSAPSPPPPSIRSLLAAQERAGLLTVSGRNGATVITTTRELFTSGSVTLRDPYPETLKAVAQALESSPGTVHVVGYTDNVPIRTPAYPDNVSLSKARAKVVADLIAADLKDPGRVTSTGLGSADPLESNGTSQGRQANRRVEITLTPPAPSQAPASPALRAAP